MFPGNWCTMLCQLELRVVLRVNCSSEGTYGELYDTLCGCQYLQHERVLCMPSAPGNN